MFKFYKLEHLFVKVSFCIEFYTLVNFIPFQLETRRFSFGFLYTLGMVVFFLEIACQTSHSVIIKI